MIDNLIGSGLVPVIASLTHSGGGQLLNTNADTVASEVAVAMTKQFDVDLVYCFDLPGVLRDINDESSLIPEIHHADYEKLKRDKVIAKGMIPKIDNAFAALEKNVSRVFLIRSTDIEFYIKSNLEYGTVILN